MTNKFILMTLIIMAFILSSCHNGTKRSSDGPFMNMKPTDLPLLLSPELISSSLDEYNGTFSHDGKDFFFTTNTPEKGIICHTRLSKNNKWTEPKIATFSGKYSEYDPIFSPVEYKVFFTSERPINNIDSSKNTNIWFVEKINENWSEPKLVALDKEGCYYSSITSNGDIYYNIWDTGDMYKAIKTDQTFKTLKLPSILNSSNGEGDPFISPSEDYLIFRGYNNSFGQGDLYISYKIDSSWTKPENLGKPINSEAHEMCPYVTLDGKYFIFSSSRINRDYNSPPNTRLDEIRKKHQSYDNGELNIYYMSADFIKEGRKKYE